MTSTELKDEIDLAITSETSPSSITPTDVGDTLKLMVDYVDQEIEAVSVSAKTSGSVTLSGTQQVLPYDVNSCSFSGGKAYLGATTVIGKEILVISTASSIEIYANVANTNFMFDTFNTFVNKVTLAQYEMYRFTYIGFGGYWKAEKL